MIKKTSNSIPFLEYWSCDKYPYYIPSVKGIEKISAPVVKNIKSPATSDKLICVLKGTALYDITPLKASETVTVELKPNDILFLSCGMQYYTVKETSEDYEFLDLSFFIYTCGNIYTHDLALSFSEAMNDPIIHKRMALYLPRVTHFEYGDEIHKCISTLIKYRNLTKTGYTIQIHTNLLQLIFTILSREKEKYHNILKNANLIGISSKFNQFTTLPDNCRLSISDINIFNSNPHTAKSSARLLSHFCSDNNWKLDPKNDLLGLENYIDKSNKMNFFTLSSKSETIYHIWLYPDAKAFTPDLRNYAENAYLHFFAKSNMEIRFGIVIYNHDIHRYISHTFHISPSKSYVEYCVPLLGGEEHMNKSAHVHKIISYITENYEHKIRVEDIAEHIHMNSSYLSAVFKEETGVSISDYIIDYRLSVAKSLLISSPESSICEIALSTGFYDTSHFSKSFKTAFQITAKEYRKQNTSS